MHARDQRTHSIDLARVADVHVYRSANTREGTRAATVCCVLFILTAVAARESHQGQQDGSMKKKCVSTKCSQPLHSGWPSSTRPSTTSYSWTVLGLAAEAPVLCMPVDLTTLSSRDSTMCCCMCTSCRVARRTHRRRRSLAHCGSRGTTIRPTCRSSSRASISASYCWCRSGHPTLRCYARVHSASLGSRRAG